MYIQLYITYDMIYTYTLLGIFRLLAYFLIFLDFYIIEMLSNISMRYYTLLTYDQPKHLLLFRSKIGCH